MYLAIFNPFFVLFFIPSLLKKSFYDNKLLNKNCALTQERKFAAKEIIIIITIVT
jgi:hypothetical protein